MHKLKVSLVRDDGVIYASRVFVRYPAPSAQALAAEHQPPPAKVSKVEYYC
jgi:hypothetical protein